MSEPTEQELDLLLAGGRRTGPVAEHMRERLLDQTAPRRRRTAWRLPAVLSTVFAVTAGASLLLVLAPKTTRLPTSAGGEARARGTASVGEALALELTCTGGSASVCPQGARLSIALAGGEAAVAANSVRYVSGFSEPEGGGPRIWYFSTEDGIASLGQDRGQTRLASRSVVLGPEHAPGRYLVQVIISARPLSRAEVLAGGTPGVISLALPLEVVPP